MSVIPTTDEAVHTVEEFMEKMARPRKRIYVITSYLGAPHGIATYTYKGLEVPPPYPRSEETGPWIMLKGAHETRPHSVKDLVNQYHGVFETEREARECFAVREEAAKNPESHYYKLIKRQQLEEKRFL